MTTGHKAQDRIGENLGRVEDEGFRRKKRGDVILRATRSLQLFLSFTQSSTDY
jgi:hypothetical protein